MTVSYNRYNEEFKTQAVMLANVVGVKDAAASLDIPYATLYNWYRSDKAERTARLESDIQAEAVVEMDSLAYINAMSGIGTETALRRENNELKKQIALLEKANGSAVHSGGVRCETEPTKFGRVIRIYLEH